MKHIDHYWVVKDVASSFLQQSKLYAYPGITPDMIFVLEGGVTVDYLGERKQISGSQLYSFIHDRVTLDVSELKSFVVVKFKSRGLSSLLPFVNAKSDQLMRQSVVHAEDLFGETISRLTAHLRTLSAEEIASELDQWFLQQYQKEKEGFMVEIAEEISDKFDLQEILQGTKYSYSTLERHFKRDTGLSPKRFQSLRRYKAAVQEICLTENQDWQHYVDKYGYFDQSHFIKEIKKYTGFTPSNLVKAASFVKYRPS